MQFEEYLKSDLRGGDTFCTENHEHLGQGLGWRGWDGNSFMGKMKERSNTEMKQTKQTDL